jgi:hypothetical protein
MLTCMYDISSLTYSGSLRGKQAMRHAVKATNIWVWHERYTTGTRVSLLLVISKHCQSSLVFGFLRFLDVLRTHREQRKK